MFLAKFSVFIVFLLLCCCFCCLLFFVGACWCLLVPLVVVGLVVCLGCVQDCWPSSPDPPPPNRRSLWPPKISLFFSLSRNFFLSSQIEFWWHVWSSTGPPFPWTAQNVFFFSLSCRNFLSFFSLFRGLLWWCFDGASNTKFPREDPQRRREKERILQRERGKKSAIFWAPRLRAPTLRAKALRASTFSGFGPLRSSFSSCCSFFLCIFNCFFFFKKIFNVFSFFSQKLFSQKKKIIFWVILACTCVKPLVRLFVCQRVGPFLVRFGSVLIIV